MIQRAATIFLTMLHWSNKTGFSVDVAAYKQCCQQQQQYRHPCDQVHMQLYINAHLYRLYSSILYK